MDQVLWVGKGVVGRVGLWEGGAAQALFADAPGRGAQGQAACSKEERTRLGAHI